jgi:hypothetical protein
MVDKYGRSKENFDKPAGYGKGGMIKGYAKGGAVKKKKSPPKPKRKPVTPAEGEVIKSGNRTSKEEAEAAKKLKKTKGYRCGGKVKKGKK